MALAFPEKKAIVAEVADKAKGAIAGLVADYRGLTVAQLNQLREQGRKQGVYIKVVKNTLAKRALADTDFQCFYDDLTGPTLIALAHEEPSGAARLFKDYVKSNDTLQVKALSVNGQLMRAAQLDYVASLPTRHEALAMLARVTKAPVSKFVRTLAAPHAKLVRAFAAVRDKKQS